MSGASNIKIDITANDRASSAIDRVNKQIASMRAPVDRTAKSIEKFSDVSGLGNLAKGMRSVGQESLQAFENITRMVGPLGAITSAATIAGMAALAVEWANLNAGLANSAVRAGMTVTQLSSLQGAARLANVSAGALTSGMTALTDNAFRAAIGHAPEVTAAFNFLGVAFMDANGHARSNTELLPVLADKLAAIKDPALQAQLATTLFGAAGEAMLPMLRLGSAEIERRRLVSARLNPVTDEMTASAERLRFSQFELGEATTGLTNSIMTGLEPILTPLLHDLAEWIHDNPEIAKGIVATVGAIGTLLGILAALRLAWFMVAGAAKTAAVAEEEAATAGVAGKAGGVLSRFLPALGALGLAGATTYLAAGPVRRPTGAMSPAGEAGSMNAAARATSLIAGFEGYRSGAYWDVNAYRAGYGSDTTTDPRTGAVTPVGPTTSGVSREAAMADLQRRVRGEFMPKAAESIGVDAWNRLNPSEQAAITSVAYNYGHVPNSVVLAARAGQAQGIHDAIFGLRGANGGVNAGRRDQEANVALEAPPAAGIGAGTGAAPATTTNLTGGADIKIQLNGFPQDTTSSADATGNMWNSPPRVEHAMPLSP